MPDGVGDVDSAVPVPIRQTNVARMINRSVATGKIRWTTQKEKTQNLLRITDINTIVLVDITRDLTTVLDADVDSRGAECRSGARLHQ